jgi:hypothetical protein
VVERIVRTAAFVCVVLTAAAAIWTRSVLAPLGVLGGGLLIGLSYWAIASTVDALTARAAPPDAGQENRGSGSETGAKRAGLHLVKIFTRHGMLALAASGRRVRLRLDPVGLLAGVSSLGIAVAVEVLRDLRWRRFP